MHSKVPINNVPRKPSLFKFKVEGFVSRGTQRELLRKKTQKQQQSMIKAFWSHFKHFERLLAENFFCSSLPARPIEVSSKPARWTYTPQPNLPEIFPADITDQFGCGQRAEFSLSVGGKGEEASKK